MISALMLVTAAASSSQVLAAPMIGNTSFGVAGSFHLPPGKTLANTNAIFINGSVTVVAPDPFDLAAKITMGLHGTLKDIASITGFPVAGIPKYLDFHNGVYIDLLTLIDDGRLVTPHSSFINLSGDVLIHAPGFAATSGFLSFTGTSTDNRAFALSITTSTNANSIPEPASALILLLGLGLLIGWATFRARAEPIART